MLSNVVTVVYVTTVTALLKVTDYVRCELDHRMATL